MLERRNTAADDDDMPASEFGRRPVVAGMQLPPFEQRRARIFGNLRGLPGSGGIDDAAGRKSLPIGLHPKPLEAAADDLDRDRAIDRQPEFLLIGGKIIGHRDRCRRLGLTCRHHLCKLHARQVVNPVDRAERQRRPAMLPGAARLFVLVEHDEVAAWPKAELHEVIGR